MLLKRFSRIESKMSSTHSLCLPIHCFANKVNLTNTLTLEVLDLCII